MRKKNKMKYKAAKKVFNFHLTNFKTIKAEDADEEVDYDVGIIEGYASVFDVVDRGGDIVAPKAFNRTLQSERKVKMLWQHSMYEPIGVWTELNIDDTGLKVTGEINLGVKQGLEAFRLIKQGAMDGLSIGYNIILAELDDDGNLVLKELELGEVSIVTFPMNEEATILSAKSDDIELDVKQINEIQGFIRKMVDEVELEPVEEEKSFDIITDFIGHKSEEEKSLDAITDFISDDDEQEMAKAIQDSINKNE